MSDDIRSYTTLQLSLSEAEIERDENLKKLMEAKNNNAFLIEKRAYLMEEVRELRGRLSVMEEIKQLAKIYEDAYSAFGYIVSNAIEVGKERGIPDAETIYVIKKAMELYDLILLPLSKIQEIEEQNEYSDFRQPVDVSEIPF